MPNGAFATEFVAIGINASFCKLGNPVKIERLGKFDLKRLGKVVASDPTARKRFNDFYLGLIEFLQRKLDQYSIEQGRLVQTYASGLARGHEVSAHEFTSPFQP